MPGVPNQKRPGDVAKKNVEEVVSTSARRSSKSSTRSSSATKNASAYNRAEERDEEVFVEQMRIVREVEEYLIKKFPKVQAQHDKLKRAEKRDKKSKRASVRASDAMKTMKISYPYTLDQIKMVMMASCVEGVQPMVQDECLHELLSKFEEEYAKQRPNAVAYMDVPKDGKAVVVGDTHGQLNDALWILVSQGLPSHKVMYLFNGDIADRGSNAILIYVIIFMFFFLYPKSILINRGNHEDLFMNQIPKASGGGFFDEVINAYDYPMYEMFLSVFKRLPLATIINKEVFVVHGGLPRMNNFTISFVDALPWNEYTTPSPESSDMKSLVFLDMLWSDPVETMGKFPSKRGAGIQFGVDITAAFLKANSLKMMIRSHQCPADNHGYFVNHQGLCLTVFSASNYCGEVGNWGATISFQGATWPQYTIAEYWAPSMDEIKPELEKVLATADGASAPGKEPKKHSEIEDISREKAQSGKSAGDLGLKAATVQKMVIHILASKPSLWTQFLHADPGMTTKVPLKEATKILRMVCGKELPWLDALDYWGVIVGQTKGKTVTEDDPKLQLDYDEFLSRFKVELSEKYEGWKFIAVTDAFRYLLARDNDLNQMIKNIDKNGDGKISKTEFRSIMEESGADLSKSQMETMMRHVGFQHGDSTKDLVDTHEFLARFAAVFKTDVMIAGKEVQRDQWAAIALDHIASHVMTVSASQRDMPTTWREANVDDKGTLFRKVFQQWDKNGDGVLSIDEFIAGLKHIPGIQTLLVEGQPLTDEKLKRIVQYIDYSHDGTVNYLEFVRALSVDDKMGTVSNALVEDITTTLFRNKQALLAACQFFDVEKTTKLKMEEFGDALEAVSHLLKPPESPFTFHQIHRLASSAVNENNEVRYMDFVNSFEIVDTSSSTDKKHNGVARTVVCESSLQNM